MSPMRLLDASTLPFLLRAAPLLLAGCGDNPSLATPIPQDSGADSTMVWDCDPAHDGWDRCAEERVQYCHVVDGTDPHFHWGTDCASLGLSCVELDAAGEAACVDLKVPCTAADERCDQNTAVYCADGHLAQQPCGTARECLLQDGAARCTDKSGPATPACEVFAGTATPEQAVADFASFPDAHVDLGKLYEIELPKDGPGYVHFPVTASGAYEVFLGQQGVFDAFMHRDGTVVSPAASGGGPDPQCSNSIADHWHATLSYDAPASGDPLPFVVRFKALSGGGAVRLMIQASGD